MNQPSPPASPGGLLFNNNTPVNTEVLWGGGLWWGLRAGAPVGNDGEQIVCGYFTVDIDIAEAGGWA